MALGEEVGRVSVRAIPDTTRFRADLKKALERIERSAEVKVKATLDDSSIRKIASDLAKTKIELDLSIDQRRIDRQFQEIIDKFESEPINLEVNANTALAARELAFVSRPRIATIHARVSATSIASAASALAALSGARLLGDILGDVGDSLANFDRNLPKIAAVTTGLGLLTAAAYASFGSLVSLGSGLASIAGTALALPGILAGFGVGLAVTIAAAKDITTVLADLGPAFARLQDSISSEFWGEAAQPIRDLVNDLLPELQRSLNAVSSSIGGFVAEWANQLNANLTTEVLAGMMDNLRKSIDIAKDSLEPLVKAFTTLGTVGSEYLPKLADWFVAISDQFNGFIQKADADGSLNRWIDEGIVNLQALGEIIFETSGIFSGFARAAEAAGLINLTGLADGLAKIHEEIDTPAFQGALETVFRGAAAGMDALGDALGPVHQLFLDLAPTIAEVLETAGQIAGELFGGIITALNDPIVAKGLTDFFDGMLSAVRDIVPVLGPLAEAFGRFMSFAGQFVAEIGPILAEAIQLLAPAFVEVLDALEPLLPLLAETLITALKDLAPVITTLVDVVLPALAEAAVTLLPIVSEAFTAAADIADIALLTIGTAIQVVIDLIHGDYKGAMDAMGTYTEDGATWAARAMQGGLGELAISLTLGLVDIVNQFATLPARITVALATLGVTLFNSMTAGFNRMMVALASGIITAVSNVATLPTRMASALAGIGGALFGAGASAIQGFIDGLGSKFAAVRATLGKLTSMLPDWKGPAAVDKVILKKPAELIMGGFQDSMEAGYGDVRRSLAGFTASLSSSAAVHDGGASDFGAAPTANSVDRIILEVGGEQVFARIVRKGERTLARGRSMA